MERFDAEIKDVDQKLKSAAQKQVQNIVKEIQDEPLSMAWRSELNEKINAIAETKQARRRYAWMWRTGLGLGLAGALATVFLFATSPKNDILPVTPSSTGGLEAKLLEVHQNDVMSIDITGAGLSALEVTYDQTEEAYEPSWNELDLETF